jgi:hypothetical protein
MILNRQLFKTGLKAKTSAAWCRKLLIGPLKGQMHPRCISGSLVMLTAMRRASSRVSLAAERIPAKP